MRYFKTIFILLICYLLILISLFVKDRCINSNKQYSLLELPGTIQLSGNQGECVLYLNTKEKKAKVLQQEKINTLHFELKDTNLVLNSTQKVSLDSFVFLYNRVDLLLLITVLYLLIRSQINFVEGDIIITLLKLMKTISIAILLSFIAKALFSYIIGAIYFSVHIKSEYYTSVFFPRVVLDWVFFYLFLIINGLILGIKSYKKDLVI